MKSLRIFFTAMAALLFLVTACKNDDDDDDTTDTSSDTRTYQMGSTVYTVDDDAKTVSIKDTGDGTGTITFYADTTYILDGRVFVNDGQTLTIEEGTMVQGMPGQGENASTLIVAQGGTIDAQGTADKPIVFTGYGDSYDGNGIYVTKVRGLWGGLIVLGKATTNNASQKRIEGIPDTEARGFYGQSEGTTGEDDDSSGILKYVSIRHGGTEIGSGNEINGLTLGGVGSGTVIENIEVVSNLDDGIEFFGGVAQVKKALVAYCGDDSYDYDEGYQGKGQFWVALQDYKIGDRCAEQDGGTGDGETADASTQSQPVIYNATYIGKEGKLMIFRDNAGGTYANSVFVNASSGIRIESRTDKHSSYEMFQEGLLTIKNNIFQDVADGTAETTMYVKAEEGDEPANGDADAAAHWTDNGNAAEDLGLNADNGDAGLPSDDDDYNPIKLIPDAAASAATAAKPADEFFEDAAYHGAFQAGGTNWASWTLTVSKLMAL